MTVAAGDAHEFAIYAGRFRVLFPLLDADGDLVTGASTPDSERSIDQGTFADCTNEMTEIATNSGVYYLDLTATETTGKTVVVIAKSATAGMKTTTLVIPIKRMPILRSGTAQAGAGSTITLDSGASAKNGAYAGMYIQCSNNSPSNVQGQTRKIISYVGSTKVATVEAAWGTNPSSATTFDILVPETVNDAAFMGAEFADWAIAGTPKVDVGGWLGTAPTAPLTAGNVVADVKKWNGTAVPAEHTAGYPIVTVKDGTGTGEIDTASGVVLAKDHLGAALATASALATVQADTDDIQTRIPAALVSGRIDASVGAMAANVLTATAINADAITAAKIADAAIDRATFAVDTGLRSSRSNTAAAGAAGSITLDASAGSVDNFYKGMLIYITGGTGIGQLRVCTGYTGSTQVATVAPNWATNPDNTSTFAVLPCGPADVEAWLGTAPTAPGTAGNVVADVKRWNGTAVPAEHTAGYPIATIKDGTGTGEIDTASGVVLAKDHLGAALATASALATVQADTDDMQTRLPAALVGGRMDSSVGAMAANVVTAAAIATDAIDADAIKADAVTEIQAGLSTLDAAGVRTAVGLATANLDTQLAAIDDYVDTEVAAIYSRIGAPAGASIAADIAAVKAVDDAVKAKTDNLPSDPADASDIAAAFGTVNTTLGTIAGYIDTEVAAIKAKTDNLPASPAAVSDIPTANDNADALLDRVDGVETGLKVREWLRLAGAALFGKSSHAGGDRTYRDVGDTKDRIVATVASGDRSSVTLDAS